ncbi:MAG: hypothetical protein JXA89_21000 [Anaerolineae bacterium]|nr:hypothetical protein [Anaerolineae bacterium]
MAGIALLCIVYVTFAVSFRAGLSLFGALCGFFTVSGQSAEARPRQAPPNVPAKSQTTIDLLRLAREAIRRGDRTAGQRMLLQVIDQDSGNETALLWLSAIVDDPVKEQVYLECEVKINPSR